MSNTPPRSTLLKRRRTKTVATVGPASHDPAVLTALIRGGIDVFHLNLAGWRANWAWPRRARSSCSWPASARASR
jgi:hypothetical protein